MKAATVGRNLGSRDFDLALANKRGEQFAESVQAWRRPTSTPSASPTTRTSTPTCPLSFFDAWTAHLVECLEAPITAALAAAGEKTSAMKTVEIVSGGSRVLAVKKFIAKLLGLDKARTNFGLASPRP